MKRLWVIGDIHFGNKSNSFEWLGYQKSLFYDFYIPFFKEYSKPGDSLILMGDLFDNKTLLNVTIINEVVNIMDDICSLFDDVWSLVGNHDVPRKDASINSYSPLRFPINFHVVDKPSIIENSFGQKLAMVPWNKSYDDELDIIKSLPDDIHDAFFHTFIIGFTFNGIFRPENTDNKKYGNEISDFSKFNRVWSGHVHTPQKKANIIFTGAALHLNRNDINQPRHFYLIDYENDGEYTEFQNEHTPMFRRYKFDDFVEMDEYNVGLMNGDFVELYVPEEMVVQDWMTGFREELMETYNFGNLTLLPVITVKDEDNEGGVEMVLPERLDIFEEVETMVKTEASYQEFDQDLVVSLILEAKNSLDK